MNVNQGAPETGVPNVTEGTLTMSQAVEYSGIPRSTLYKLMHAGRFAYIATGPCGKGYRVYRDSFTAFLDGLPRGNRCNRADSSE